MKTLLLTSALLGIAPCSYAADIYHAKGDQIGCRTAVPAAVFGKSPGNILAEIVSGVSSFSTNLFTRGGCRLILERVPYRIVKTYGEVSLMTQSDVHWVGPMSETYLPNAGLVTSDGRSPRDDPTTSVDGAPDIPFD
jgi:hypothetical protein